MIMRVICELFLILIILCSNCYSQSISSPYEAGTWQGFRTAAVSYTFDDLSSSQLTLAVPMFNEKGFQLTLFPVINWSPYWTGLQNAANQGHEIASHTVSHTSLSSLSDSLQREELKNSQATINSRISGQKCLTIAYPYCNVGNTSIISQYYIAARICSGVIERSTPADFMSISSIICGTQGSVKTSTDFKSKADAAVSARGWCVYLIHGIDNDGGYSPISSDTLRASLEYLKANPGKFWVTSFGNAAKYIRERNSVSVSEISNQSDTIVVQVADAMDNSLYNVPLTVRRPLPDGWTSADVAQNGVKVASQILEINSVKYLMFDVIPDNGNIMILKVSETGIESHSANFPESFRLNQNFPNPFNPSTSVSYQLPDVGSQYIVTLKVFDMLGREIITLVNEPKAAGSYSIMFNANALTSGVYFYRLQANNLSAGSGQVFAETKKLLLVK